MLPPHPLWGAIVDGIEIDLLRQASLIGYAGSCNLPDSDGLDDMHDLQFVRSTTQYTRQDWLSR